VIGPSVAAEFGFASCDQWNRAYEVTDCGLVVGQLAVRTAPPDPGQDPCLSVTRHAFIYSSGPRPDLGLANELRLLENPVDRGAVAFDANDHGFIVGAAGGDTPELVYWDFAERAVMWRLRPAQGGAVVTATVVDPPPDVHPGTGARYFRPYEAPDYGYGRLSSVQAGETPHAAGTFSLRFGCPGQQNANARTGAVAVRFAADGSISYRPSRSAEMVDPDGPMAVTEERAEAIADTSLLLAGFRESACDISGSLCNGSALHDAAVWMPDTELPPWLVAEWRTPDPFEWFPFPDAETPFDSVAPIQAIKDDGTAAGWVSDHVPGPPGGLYPCEKQAAAWAPGAGSVVKILGGFHAPECALRHQFFESESTDLDRVVISPEDGVSPENNAGALGPGPTSGVVVVGSGKRYVDPVAPTGQPRARRSFGALWFRPDGDQAWGSEWSYREVTDMVSPASPLAEPPPESKFRVSLIEGVNVHGDMAGQLLVEQQVNGVTERTYYPILLRAVKVSGVGDFNRDGTVDSSDLAVVLSAWCDESAGVNCSATADLNLDGSVDSADLGMVLSRWGAQSNPPTCQLGLAAAPPAVAQESKQAVDFSIQYVGLQDLDVYRQWTTTAPEILRDLVDGAIFDVSKDLLETAGNEGGEQ
jgi:hypothetical protein